MRKFELNWLDVPREKLLGINDRIICSISIIFKIWEQDCSLPLRLTFFHLLFKGGEVWEILKNPKNSSYCDNLSCRKICKYQQIGDDLDEVLKWMLFVVKFEFDGLDATVTSVLRSSHNNDYLLEYSSNAKVDKLVINFRLSSKRLPFRRYR